MSLAVVTGGTRGIGLALSHKLIELGHRVVAIYRGDVGQAEAVAGPDLVPVQLDLAEASAVRDGVAAIQAEHGPPTVLVNNAGVNRDRPFLELSDDDWDLVLASNLSGPFRLTQAFAPAMLAAGGGSIVNVAATTALRPRANGANYCASKAGLLHLTRCLALELAPTIRVNALLPGYTDTEELRARYRLDDPAVYADTLTKIPLGRMASPAQIAEAFALLVSPAGAYLTGQQLIVDGGNYLG